MDEPLPTKEEEYLNNWKRAQADLINYQKDENKRMEAMLKFGNENLVLAFLEVISNLELASQHIPDEGLKNILKQFESLLKKYSVERIAVTGQKFDPAVHEAVDEIIENKELVEVRPGYTMHGRVICPSRVTTK